MAKSNIHPVYNDLTVVLTDGTKFKTKSCCKDKIIKLDVDPLNHPAWRKDMDRFVNLKNDRISKFNKKFGNFSFGTAKKPEEVKEVKKEVKKEEKVKEVKKEEKVKEIKKEVKKEVKKEEKKTEDKK